MGFSLGKTLGGALGFFGDEDEAGEAAREAAGTQAAYQREALEYLKEREAIPQQFREGALTRLGGLYGLEGGEGDQQMLIEQARQSPLYQAILGTQEAGEEAILRQASATGGLRSGSAQGALARNAQELEQQALLQAYSQQLQGIQGLANLPSNVNQIAAGTAGIGQTLAQGQVAGAQADIASQGRQTDQLMGLAQMGMMAFSDIRLKDNIKKIGAKNGHNWYSWTWNNEAGAIGLTGSDEGVMAHEVYDMNPDAT
jgi:hypothetical protein